MDQFKRICPEVNSQEGSSQQTRTDTANQEHSEMGNSAQVPESGTQNEVNSFDVKAHMRKQWKIVGLSAIALALMIIFDVFQPAIVIWSLGTGILIGIAFTTWLEYGEEPQLSGKQDGLNPNAPGPESGASAEDSKAGEFNGLTLEVNPKPKSSGLADPSAMLGGCMGGVVGHALLGNDFWDEAPAWANYWACDADGQCYWYQYKPNLLDGGGRWLNGGYYIKDMNVPAPGTDCKHSLICRPGIQEQAQ